MAFRLTPRQTSGVFRICYNNSVGTAFLYFTDRGCVFATAAHNLQGLQVGDNVLLQRDAGWFSLTTADAVFHPKGHDVCIFSGRNLAIDFDHPPYEDVALWLGEPVRFLGFPHGLRNTYPGNGFPTPLVRNAHFSGVINLEGKEIILLDGFNNPGYSGGPVYGLDLKGNVALAGVISGYRFELESHGAVYRKPPGGTEEAVPDLYVKPNSGMIYCASLGDLKELVPTIKSFNPVIKPRGRSS